MDSGPERGSRALLGLCIAAAILSASVFAFDHEISRSALAFKPTEPLAKWLSAMVKAFGKAEVLIVVLLLACLTRLRRPAMQGLIALALIALPVVLIKLLVNRDRPSHSGDSFPSGDVASVVAALLPMAMVSRRMIAPVGAVIVLVSVFRLVEGWHYPSDVLAGVALGLLALWWVVKAAPRKWLRPRARRVLPFLLLALAVCVVIAATGSDSSPTDKFAIAVLPVLLIWVILERRRIARVSVTTPAVRDDLRA